MSVGVVGVGDGVTAEVGVVPGVEGGDKVGLAVGGGVDDPLRFSEGVELALGFRATSELDVGVGLGAVSENGEAMERRWLISVTVMVEVPNSSAIATIVKLPGINHARRSSPNLRRRIRRPDRQKRRSFKNASPTFPNRRSPRYLAVSLGAVWDWSDDEANGRQSRRSLASRVSPVASSA